VTTPTRSTALPSVAASTLRGWRFFALRRLLRTLLRLLTGYKVEGVEHVPPQGPLLVVSNHLHNADPVLVAVAIPRPLHYMAKKELFAIPVLRRLITYFGAFPVDRGKADRNAIRLADARLAEGFAVGMFPEGTRSVTGTMQPAHPGIALLALRSGAPVLPVAVIGSERLPGNTTKGRRNDGRGSASRRNVRVVLGSPFSIPRERDGRKLTADEATALIMGEVAALLPPEYRGVYGEHARPSVAQHKASHGA